MPLSLAISVFREYIENLFPPKNRCLLPENFDVWIYKLKASEVFKRG